MFVIMWLVMLPAAGDEGFSLGIPVPGSILFPLLKLLRDLDPDPSSICSDTFLKLLAWLYMDSVSELDASEYEALDLLLATAVGPFMIV